MGRHQTTTCNVCFKSMRSDKLKKHMKKHDVKTEDDVVNKELDEGENQDNIVTKRLDDVGTDDNILTKRPQIRYTEEQYIALKKKVSAQMEEFDRKMELGRNLNKIMNESGYNENVLDNDMMDTLKTYELHGKNMDMKNNTSILQIWTICTV